MIGKLLLCAVIGYLLGSFSTGILVARQQGHDIRAEGSQNTGASNALRILGLKGGAITFLGDFLKAALSVIAGLLIAEKFGGMAAGLGAILGHNWPLFFRFQGGKGIACSTAVLLILFFWQGAVAALICLAVIYFTRYISVGSLTMLTVFFLLMLCSMPLWPYAVWAFVLMALGYYRHIPNLKRLRDGNENKIGQKATK